MRVLKTWTEADIKLLREEYGIVSNLKDLAVRLGRSPHALHNKAARLGVKAGIREFVKPNDWAEEDLQQVREAYANWPVDLEGLAFQLDRTVKAVSGIANKLGVSKGLVGRAPKSLEVRQCMSVSIKKSWECAKLTGTSHMSEESLQKRSDNALKQVKSGTIYGGYSRTKSGKREDLDGQFFRSSWEANYARYLNFLNVEGGRDISWEFEPCTFYFEKIKRGTRSYTPDFLILAPGTDTPRFFVEVKGWMDAKSKTKLKRMRLYYPDERIVLVGAKEYRVIERAYASRIEFWEHSKK